MKIKELSSLTGVSERTIRYYIDDGLFVPENCTESYSGRRSYDFSESDVIRLKEIALLRKYDFSIVDIKKLFDGDIDINGLLTKWVEEAEKNTEEKTEEINTVKVAIGRQPKSIDELCNMLSNPVIEQEPIPNIDEQSAYKPMYTKEKKSNKKLSVIVCIIAIMLVLCIPLDIFLLGRAFFRELESELSVDIVDDYRYMYQDYIHHLADGYCIFRTAAGEQSFIYYPLWRENDGKIEKDILGDITIYKYGLSKNAEWVYIHYYVFDYDSPTKVVYNSAYEGISKNCFFLYNIKDKTQTEFKSNAEFYEYCKGNGIVFEKFYYPAAGGSNEESRVYINDDAYISNVGRYRGQTIVLNGEAIFEGYIEEYSIIDRNTVAFSLKIAKDEDNYGFEYPSVANKGIKLNDKKVGKYKVDFLLRYDIFYSKYIVYDFTTNTFKEYNKKRDIEKEYDAVFVRLT